MPVLFFAAGLALGGMPGALVASGFYFGRRVARSWPPRQPGIGPILFSLLIEVRSGSSILGALLTVAEQYPEHRDLRQASRMAAVSGLTVAIGSMEGDLRPVLSQLARAQRSGSPIADSIRAMIDAHIARDKAAMIARARRLPIRLMIPVTTMILPGLVLLFYAPALIRMFGEISGSLT
ncbi:MAG: type II secretion system F family protein [Acidimicrobiia bacterium]